MRSGKIKRERIKESIRKEEIEERIKNNENRKDWQGGLPKEKKKGV